MLIKYIDQKKIHLGTYVSNEESNIGYIVIPKNASSFMRQSVQINCNWSNEFNYNLNPKNKYIVILRDPFERWIAGTVQYFHQEHDYFNFANEKMLKFICKRVMLDTHTELQTNFLEGLNTENIEFFKFNEKLSHRLKIFFKRDLKVSNYVDLPLINRSNNDSKKVKMKNILRTFLHENPNYIADIKTAYDPDYKLISEVKFFTGM